MTFNVIARVDLRADPDFTEKVLQDWHVDIVQGTALSLTELSAPSLNLEVGTGTCYILGYFVDITAAETKAMATSSTNHVYVRLTRNGNSQVTGAEIHSNTTGGAVTDAMKIAEVVTNATEITTITSKQFLKEDKDVTYIKGRSAAPADPELTTDGKTYIKNIDSNNEGFFIKLKVDGGIKEVQIA